VDGLLDPVARTIFIDRSLSKEDKFWTFLHEFIHAVFESNDIGHNSSNKDRLMSTEHEEDLISALEAELKSNFSLRWRKMR
jgi:Zn-dependent peptidase ImmA (M78 family)